MPGPIKPECVEALQVSIIPEAVFEVFNKLIAKNWDGVSTADVTQEEAVTGVCEALGIDRSTAYGQGLLNVEAAYRAAGWIVKYEKPGYNEVWAPRFIFTRPRQS